MQKLLTSAFYILIFMIYWSVHDTIDAKLFGPSTAAEIKTPEKAVNSIDLYPGYKVIENGREHYDAEEGDVPVWRYTWNCEVAQSASVVADFYKRRVGEPVKTDEEFYAYEEVVFEKAPTNGKKGELTRIIVVPDPEKSDHTYLFIEQNVASNASSMSWDNRRTVVHLLILGGLAGFCTLGLFLMKKLNQTRETVAEPVTTYVPPPSVVPQPAAPEEPAPAPGPPSDDATFFEELEAKIAADHPDWKVRRERFELTVQRLGKAPVSLDIEPLFYLWKRPGVDRNQAIGQFLEGRIR